MTINAQISSEIMQYDRVSSFFIELMIIDRQEALNLVKSGKSQSIKRSPGSLFDT